MLMLMPMLMELTKVDADSTAAKETLKCTSMTR